MLSSQNCDRPAFSNTALFLLATCVLPPSPNFGEAKHGQKKFLPLLYRYILNPECVRIPWLLAPKNFPVENFRVLSSIYENFPFFHEVACPHWIFFVGLLQTHFDATNLPNS